MTQIAYKIKHGSKLHDKVVEEIWDRFHLSKREMSEMHERWKRAEQAHQLYVPLKDKEQVERGKRRTNGDQVFTKLVIPYSYAMVMAAHTYFSTVFLARSPILQFMGTGGEDEAQTQAVEAIMDYQVRVGGHMVPYYIWLLDPLKYGVGVLGTHWTTEWHTRSFYEEVEDTVAGVPIEGTKRRVKRVQRLKGYEGSKVYNVRPWDFYPDPRVPLYECHKGEFCGRVVEVGWNTILRGAQDGRYFNIEELQNRMASGDPDTSRDQANFESGEGIKIPDATSEGLYKQQAKGYVRLLEMVVDLIPTEWGLGETAFPEKWVFTLACPGKLGVLIGAQPLGEAHDRLPFFVQQYDIEGYNLSNRSMYDVLEPLQQTMDWLINTHFFNIRRALNDMILVDPTRVVMADLLEPKPGKIVRAKPAAYGQDVRLAVHQFQISDVTNQHLADTRVIADLMQRVSGVTDNTMGLLSQGGRKTATEVRQANTLGVNRLKTVTEYFSSMGWAPLAQVMLQATQQHYTEERAFRIVGDTMPSNGSKFVNVSPEDIAGFYDFVPIDGNMPIDRFAQVSLWTQLLGQLRQFPQIAGQYDMGGIFSWVAQLAGLRNINQFKIQLAPDATVAAQMQAGNIVSAGQAAGESGLPDIAQILGAGAGRSNGTGPAL